MKHVTLKHSTLTLSIALGIAEDGALRVRDGDGGERRVHAGDVSVRTHRPGSGQA